MASGQQKCLLFAKCSQELKLSRTTIETAYLQLAADGYIMAKAQSGYYVTEIASHHHMSSQPDRRDEIHYRYDLASSGVDRESFRFDLWSRYMKSALRQDERMLTYGEPPGGDGFPGSAGCLYPGAPEHSVFPG